MEFKSVERQRERMNRLELLKQEKEVISKMQTLSFSLKDQCQEWYDHEIECIEVYGSENPEVNDSSEDDSISTMDLLNKLHKYFSKGFENDEWWNSRYVLQAIKDLRPDIFGEG